MIQTVLALKTDYSEQTSVYTQACHFLVNTNLHVHRMKTPHGQEKLISGERVITWQLWSKTSTRVHAELGISHIPNSQVKTCWWIQRAFGQDAREVRPCRGTILITEKQSYFRSLKASLSLPAYNLFAC